MYYIYDNPQNNSKKTTRELLNENRTSEIFKASLIKPNLEDIATEISKKTSKGKREKNKKQKMNYLRPYLMTLKRIFNNNNI